MTSTFAASQSLTFTQILDRPELKATQPDHKIAYGKDALQFGELWLPPSPSKVPLPVVVVIHGGCWRADLPGHLQRSLSHWERDRAHERDAVVLARKGEGFRWIKLLAP